MSKATDLIEKLTTVPSLNKWHKHRGHHYTYDDSDGNHWEISPFEDGFSLVVRSRLKNSSWKWITLDSKVSNISGVSKTNLFNSPALAAKAASKVQL